MSNRTDILYITDIRESIEAIFSYTESSSFEDFSSDRMKYSAVIREFEIIGEAVGKLSDSLKNEHAQINWECLIEAHNLKVPNPDYLCITKRIDQKQPPNIFAGPIPIFWVEPRLFFCTRTQEHPTPSKGKPHHTAESIAQGPRRLVVIVAKHIL